MIIKLLHSWVSQCHPQTIRHMQYVHMKISGARLYRNHPEKLAFFVVHYWKDLGRLASCNSFNSRVYTSACFSIWETAAIFINCGLFKSWSLAVQCLGTFLLYSWFSYSTRAIKRPELLILILTYTMCLKIYKKVAILFTNWYKTQKTKDKDWLYSKMLPY